MRKNRRPVGRPPLPADRVRGKRIVLMLTAKQCAKLKRLARRQQIPPSTMAFRLVVMALARRQA